MSKHKNLLIFHTDQQRYDSLGCNGNPVARTPNIDALAANGVRFDSHYAANMMCMPSRASFFTGRYPQAHRVLDNGIGLPETEVTLAHILRDAGYHSHAIGKLHLSPWNPSAKEVSPEAFHAWRTPYMNCWTGPYYGFEHVELLLGHGESAYQLGGHYGKWVHENFPDFGDCLGPGHAEGPKCADLGVWRSNLPLEAHHSVWAADRAISYLKERGEDNPFFLFVGFLDPHHPFTPPAPYSTMFEGCEFPGPYRLEGEMDTKPVHYRRAMSEKQHPYDGGAHNPSEMTDEVLNQIMLHTYGMVSLIDDSIGRVLNYLDECGLREDTIVLFTSDHGELLGDHHMLYKGPYPCRSLLQIPLIISCPGVQASSSDALLSNVDIMPTLLDLLGMEIPRFVQGKSFRRVMLGETESIRDATLSSGWSKDSPIYYNHTLYRRDFRLSYFPHQDDGELYDLQSDPHEYNNLFHNRRYRKTRDQMMLELLRAIGLAEPSNLVVEGPW